MQTEVSYLSEKAKQTKPGLSTSASLHLCLTCTSHNFIFLFCFCWLSLAPDIKMLCTVILLLALTGMFISAYIKTI